MAEPDHKFIPESIGCRYISGSTRVFTSLHRDSRTVVSGGLFFCLSSGADAITHLKDAATRGASGAVIASDISSDTCPPSLSLWYAPNHVALALAHAAAEFYPAPSLDYACAVTGTNGKTSVAHIFRCLSAAAGKGALSVGTLGMIPERADPPAEAHIFNLTSPDALTLHAHVARYSERHGIRTLCVEASSHGLDQHRVDGLCFNSVIFTNITEDHLDYHITQAAYFAAKRRIFDITAPGALAVICADMPECSLLKNEAACKGLRPLTIGYDSAADCIISDRKNNINGGQSFVLTMPGNASRTIHLSLSGAFQAYNACFALAAAYDAFPDHYDLLCNALGCLPEVPGRMQRITLPDISGDDYPAVYVDFAHTPDALINAANALKQTAKGRLVIIFGCGGDRDTAKRPLMGHAAALYGDRVIVTDDNPRTENAATIRKEILSACPQAEEIFPREDALKAAIKGSRTNDTILIAGKGHENYQIIGTKRISYSDIDTAYTLLKELTESSR